MNSLSIWVGLGVQPAWWPGEEKEWKTPQPHSSDAIGVFLVDELHSLYCYSKTSGLLIWKSPWVWSTVHRLHTCLAPFPPHTHAADHYWSFNSGPCTAIEMVGLSPAFGLKMCIVILEEKRGELHTPQPSLTPLHIISLGYQGHSLPLLVCPLFIVWPGSSNLPNASINHYTINSNIFRDNRSIGTCRSAHAKAGLRSL